MAIKLPARTARLLLQVNLHSPVLFISKGTPKFCFFLYQSCGSLKTAAIGKVCFHPRAFPAVSSESSVTQVQETYQCRQGAYVVSVEDLIGKTCSEE